MRLRKDKNRKKNRKTFSEEEIQEEIRKRVLQEAKKREGKLNAEEATQATLDALSEIVSLSREEMEKIAEQVRKEFSGDGAEKPFSKKSRSRNWMFPWGAVILLIITILLARRGSSWYLFAGFIVIMVLYNLLKDKWNKDD